MEIEVQAILESDKGKELLVSGLVEGESIRITEKQARKLHEIIDKEILEPERWMVRESLDSAVWGD